MISMENDVKTARTLTSAPVVFVTGMDPAPLRLPALAAGAYGVISKSALSADLLSQFLENAMARAALPAPPVLELADEEAEAVVLPPTPVWPMAQPTLASLAAAINQLEHALACVAVPMGGGRAASDPVLQKVLPLARCLKLLASRPFASTVWCDAAGLMRALRPSLLDHASARDVALTLNTPPEAHCLLLGAKRHAKGGLEALVQGLIESCEAGDWLSFNLSLEDDQVSIDVSSNAARILDIEDAFTGDLHEFAVSQGLLQGAVHLLGLRPEQIETRSGRVFGVTIHL
jgi:hypothetical protein